MTERRCTQDDLRIEVIATARPDGNGDPIPDVYDWDIGYNEPFFCAACGRGFGLWQDAIAHLNSAEAA